MRKVLEHLEENPTSSADDWGDEIAADKKLYSSSSSSSRCKRKYRINCCLFRAATMKEIPSCQLENKDRGGVGAAV